MADSAEARRTGTDRVKRGLAEMLRGGVIMDVVDAEQAKIAEDAGAVAVMALERVPADIRRDEMALASRGMDAFDDFRALLDATRRDDHLRAFLGEADGGGCTESRARARDQRDFSSKQLHGRLQGR